MYNYMVNQMMCSELCPCSPNDKKTIKDKYPDNIALAQYGRNWEDYS
jgi:hypothetical protein